MKEGKSRQSTIFSLSTRLWLIQSTVQWLQRSVEIPAEIRWDP